MANIFFLFHRVMPCDRYLPASPVKKFGQLLFSMLMLLMFVHVTVLANWDPVDDVSNMNGIGRLAMESQVGMIFISVVIFGGLSAYVSALLCSIKNIVFRR